MGRRPQWQEAAGRGRWRRVLGRGAEAACLDLSRPKPELARKHRQRYAVRATYDVHRLQEMLEALGMTLLKHTYLFRSRSAEYLYLTLSARGGRYGWNAAAPVAPVMRFAYARVPDERGSVLLVHARAAD